MAIAYSEEKKSEWENFKQHGGSITFMIDREDISSTNDFENFPEIQPHLETGFEIPPTCLIQTPELQALIATHGSTWDYILCRIYLSDGKVTYRKLENGRYEAICEVPTS
jgi:hypothetical protein